MSDIKECRNCGQKNRLSPDRKGKAKCASCGTEIPVVQIFGRFYEKRLLAIVFGATAVIAIGLVALMVMTSPIGELRYANANDEERGMMDLAAELNRMIDENDVEGASSDLSLFLGLELQEDRFAPQPVFEEYYGDRAKAYV